MTALRRTLAWGRGRPAGVAVLAVAVVLLGLFVATWLLFLLQGGASDIGVDYVLYRDAALRFAEGGGFYPPHQLAGPYEIRHGDVLYPPTVLLLLLPFAVLPAVAWWLVPLGFTAWLVLGWRPGPVAWLAIAACLFFPITGVKLWHGNPGIWFMAAVAGGLRFGWPSAMVLLKPTLLPFALIGVHRRRWWLAVAGLALASLPFLPLWPDYLAAMLHARSDLGLLYSLNEVPLLAIPVLAWLGARRPEPVPVPAEHPAAAPATRHPA